MNYGPRIGEPKGLIGDGHGERRAGDGLGGARRSTSDDIDRVRDAAAYRRYRSTPRRPGLRLGVVRARRAGRPLPGDRGTGARARSGSTASTSAATGRADLSTRSSCPAPPCTRGATRSWCSSCSPPRPRCASWPAGPGAHRVLTPGGSHADGRGRPGSISRPGPFHAGRPLPAAAGGVLRLLLEGHRLPVDDGGRLDGERPGGHRAEPREKAVDAARPGWIVIVLAPNADWIRACTGTCSSFVAVRVSTTLFATQRDASRGSARGRGRGIHDRDGVGAGRPVRAP